MLKTRVLLMLSMFWGSFGSHLSSPIGPKKIDNIYNIKKTPGVMHISGRGYMNIINSINNTRMSNIFTHKIVEMWILLMLLMFLFRAR